MAERAVDVCGVQVGKNELFENLKVRGIRKKGNILILK